MKNTLYLECFSGISGDMSVSALLDLGANVEVLRQGLESLNVTGYEIEISRMKKCGIDACHFDVILEGDHTHHSHEHHSHEHHSHEHHSHEHRNLDDIVKIIDNSTISDNAKRISKNIFDFVADAEAKAHALPKNEVHFHEVGAVDSIVDIVAVAICIDNLQIEDVCVSTIYEGQGYVKCQHGTIPVPVPAVTNIASVSGLSLRITNTQGEMVTPTGIAIAAALKNIDELPENMKIVKIGIGCGKKDFKHANILRAMLIQEDATNDEVTVLETNIDDSSGEALAYTLDKLFTKGVNDAFFTPIYMKKNRPATKLTVICNSNIIGIVEDIIFSNLSTIGIRKYKATRSILAREIKKVETKYGMCTIKICTHKDNTYVYPEYDDVKALCDSQNLSFDDVYTSIKSEVNKK